MRRPRLDWINPDPDRSGRQLALTVMTPVLEGRSRALAEAIHALPKESASPFASVPGTHFARLVLVPQLRWEPGRRRRRIGRRDGDGAEKLRNEYLLFSTCSSDHLDGHIEAIRTGMPQEADAIWSHCVNYPGAAQEVPFHGWIRRGLVRTSLFHAGYPNATVEDVKGAVDIRNRLVAYAIDAQELSPANAHRRYLAEFGR